MPKWQHERRGNCTPPLPGEGTAMVAPTTDQPQSCEDVVAGVSVPEPWDFRAFVNSLGAAPHRPIELIPVTADPTQPSGLLVSTDRADYIFYAANTTPLHQLHIQWHELAHLLRGHSGTMALDRQVTALLMPSLPASVVERVLGRTVYSTVEEHEAELFATLIMRRLGRTQRGRTARPDVATALTGLACVLDILPGRTRG